MTARAGGTGPTSRSGYVALLGWTNVGKSTLLNRLVGVKLAAVAEVAQTTRSRIEGVRTIADRGQVVLVDTPGLHRPRHAMNRAMVRVARQAVGAVDLVLLIVDAKRGLGPGDREVADWLATTGAPRLGVLNKIDLLRSKSSLLPMMETLVGEWGLAEALPVSALTGEGCDMLLDRVLQALPEGPPLFPEEMLTDQPERVLAAEWIREKLLAETRQELPHATAVIVERWQERHDGLLEIEATVLVEHDSQKKIVVGRGGELLKRVGTAARLELERFLDQRVYLRLWVRVRRDWRNDRQMLRRMGLS
jgi:GTP-binding protein Era